MPTHQKIRAGDAVTFKATVIQPSTDDRLVIDTPDGPRTLHRSMILSTEERTLEVGDTVESKLPNRQGLIGVIRFIEGCDVMVRWPMEGRPDGKCTVEEKHNLRWKHVKPM